MPRDKRSKAVLTWLIVISHEHDASGTTTFVHFSLSENNTFCPFTGISQGDVLQVTTKIVKTSQVCSLSCSLFKFSTQVGSPQGFEFGGGACLYCLEKYLVVEAAKKQLAFVVFYLPYTVLCLLKMWTVSNFNTWAEWIIARTF